MKTTKPSGSPAALLTTPHQLPATFADDCFAGYGPQPIRCRWLPGDDEERAKTARIIRLIVDHNRWDNHHYSNVVYQQHFLREIADFTGPTRAVLTTPAGMITTPVAWL